MVEEMSLAKVMTTLKVAYHLSERTESEIMLVFHLDGAIHSYTSAAFEPLFKNKDGRALFVSLLGPDVHLRKDFLRMAIVGPETPLGVDWDDAADYADVDAVAADADMDVRRATFARLSRRLLEMCVALSPPETPDCDLQYALVVATWHGVVLTESSPVMRPLTHSDAGRALILTMLRTRALPEPPAAGMPPASGPQPTAGSGAVASDAGAA